ncbi:MAG: hypothetical protein IJ088_07930 [Clostridia bacterium]|nr:hypothetical protein [Clostridia bacterium]
MAVPAELARTVTSGERLVTRSYRKKVSVLCINTSYRKACDIFNEMSLRTEKGNKIPINTFIRDFVSEGLDIRKAKQDLARKIMQENGFDIETFRQENGRWPGTGQASLGNTIPIGGTEILSVLIEEWDPENPKLEGPEVTVSEESTSTNEETAGLRKLFMDPDTDPMLLLKKRRTTRIEADEEDVEWICNGYVAWLKHCKILYQWTVEKGSARTAYIAMDAVHVVEQSEKHIKGGKPGVRTGKNRIGHWDIGVEFDGLRYSLTALTRKEAFQQLFACLISNGLMDRYFVFFAGGEPEIFEDIEEYFGERAGSLIPDWLHLEKKVMGCLGSAIYHKMCPDPRKKDTDAKVKDTALSMLYARKIVRILWVGNVEEAIVQLKSIKSDDIKDHEKIEWLIDYLQHTEKWIVCYALRKRAGLRNSFGGSEGADNILTCDRQKDNGMGWRRDGSSAEANMMCLFANDEQDLWFSSREVTFKVHARRMEAKS